MKNMEMENVQEKDNAFFKRKDVTFTVRHIEASTPSKSDIVKTVAQSRGVDESQVVIDFVFTKRGQAESFVKLKVLNEKPPAPKQQEQPVAPAEQSQPAPETKPEEAKQ
jgi:ribosomal protein S24E